MHSKSHFKTENVKTSVDWHVWKSLLPVKGGHHKLKIVNNDMFDIVCIHSMAYGLNRNAGNNKEKGKG